MDNDDKTIGRMLTRREALLAMGVAGFGLLGGFPLSLLARADDDKVTRAPSRVVRPEMTEGPFFVDEHLDRSDVRPDPTTGKVSAGARLDLTFQVSRLLKRGAVALPGAVVDLWHCDANGAYSDVDDRRSGARGSKFLRGYQRTDADGVARFTTIVPGWYQGRAVHIHFKIRSSDTPRPAYEFTSQLFFQEKLLDEVHAQAAYKSRGRRETMNADDGIFQDGGTQLLLDVKKTREGYVADFDLALELQTF